MTALSKARASLLTAGALLTTTVLSNAAFVTSAEAQFVIDEIVVMARKRPEGQQDAPLAVTAFNTASMEARNVANLSDLAKYTPALQLDGAAALSGGNYNATIFIRGIGQNDFANFSDPGVGVYVDGVYYARSIGAILDVVDFDSVEVLKGPQGTLFGKNTIGGAISMNTTKPQDEFSGRVQITGGRFDRIDGKAMINAPIVEDKLLLRLNVATLNRNGYAHSLTTGEEMGDVDRIAGRAQLLWRASENLTVHLAVDGTRAREHSAPNTMAWNGGGGFPFRNIFDALVAPALPLVAPNGLKGVNASWMTNDPYTTYGSYGNVNDLDTWGASLTVETEFAGIDFKSITGYRELDALFARDGDNTPYNFRHTRNDNDQNQLSQEFQFSGSFANGALDWLVGAYYFRENAFDHANAFLAEGIYPALEALPGPRVFSPPGPPAPIYGGAGNPANTGTDLMLDLLNDIDNETAAFFTHNVYHVTEQLSVTAGLRWTWDKKTFTSVQQRMTNLAYVIPPGTVFQDSWTSWSPKIGAEYKANEDVLLYLSASRGFKSGGFNGRPIGSVAEVTQFNPETAWSYEGGLKSEWFDNRLRANLAVYYMEYSDIQLTVNDTPRNFVSNAAKAEVKGGELELVARPTEELTVDASVGYIDAQYTSLYPPTGLSVNTLGITLDSKLIKTPKWMTHLGVQYDFVTGNSGTISVRGDWSYKSGAFHTVENWDLSWQPGFSLFDARLSWESADERWGVAVFGQNLSDERYFVSANRSVAFGVGERSYAIPRTWGVSATARF